MTNTHPKGLRVAIKRHRHGWLGGSVHGTVREVIPRDTGACGYIVDGDDGAEYEIRNTKDIRAA
ncbi:hypothetical protein LAV_00140 [Sphingobium phage Lacusarx]|uniref:Uncharacterized protein n=1 Tax=Sphingobium phage Lacusarx TaxID=1980139 RepID=A0A1W6DX87_9CAUD|nr:hypothetical protein FDH44_gp163 [Sphingobium phage Lacusarx]ARK07515.1 hypothetical protein LAV_00140 [Sphingobium phage Lacusarx]